MNTFFILPFYFTFLKWKKRLAKVVQHFLRGLLTEYYKNLRHFTIYIYYL